MAPTAPMVPSAPIRFGTRRKSRLPVPAVYCCAGGRVLQSTRACTGSATSAASIERPPWCAPLRLRTALHDPATMRIVGLSIPLTGWRVARAEQVSGEIDAPAVLQIVRKRSDHPGQNHPTLQNAANKINKIGRNSPAYHWTIPHQAFEIPWLSPQSCRPDRGRTGAVVDLYRAPDIHGPSRCSGFNRRERRRPRAGARAACSGRLSGRRRRVGPGRGEVIIFGWRPHENVPSAACCKLPDTKKAQVQKRPGRNRSRWPATRCVAPALPKGGHPCWIAA
jgi:hypothetical protein